MCSISLRMIMIDDASMMAHNTPTTYSLSAIPHPCSFPVRHCHCHTTSPPLPSIQASATSQCRRLRTPAAHAPTNATATATATGCKQSLRRDFRPIDSDLTLDSSNVTALCSSHSREKCDECDVDYVQLNRLSKIFNTNPKLPFSPPPNIVNQKLP